MGKPAYEYEEECLSKMEKHDPLKCGYVPAETPDDEEVLNKSDCLDVDKFEWLHDNLHQKDIKFKK